MSPEEVDEIEVEPERDGLLEKDAEPDGDCEFSFCVAELTADGVTDGETETDPDDEPDDEGELDIDTDAVYVSETVAESDASNDADCAAVPVPIVAVAQDAETETLGVADALYDTDSDGAPDTVGVPERHCVTVAENESMEAEGCGVVDIATDDDGDAERLRVDVDCVVDDDEIDGDRVAATEKVVPQ